MSDGVPKSVARSKVWPMTFSSVAEAVFTSQAPWAGERPRVLVVCCSDGRLQEATDEFLHGHLGIRGYDRVYAAGGPGALAPGGYEFLRAAQYRDDLAFLVRAHRVEELILIFHGAAPDGPAEATCAHYGRVMPGAGPDAVREQQGRDLEDVRVSLGSLGLAARVRAFRAEVRAHRQIQFVPMG